MWDNETKERGVPERKSRREGLAGTMSPAQQARLERLIADGQEHAFYLWTDWKAVRAAVLRLDRWECQVCREHGRYSRGEIVHHVKHLKDRPDLALEIWDPQTGERQLVTVCKACHEAAHPDALQRVSARVDPVTDERWD